MNVRKLELKDTVYMYEWMRDDKIACNFAVDFKHKTMDDVKEFIQNGFNQENQHFACVTADDEYMGTVSLKNIDHNQNEAEYAIVFRGKAHGQGYAAYATKYILEYAFTILELERVYLNVYDINLHARHFYEKVGFQSFLPTVEQGILGEEKDLKWYQMKKVDFKRNKLCMPEK